MAKREIFLRSGFNYDADEVSRETGLACKDKSLAQESFKEECDINEIVRRFGLTGQLPENLAMPVSGDFTGVSDFHTAMNMVRAAQEGFMQLPADVRYRFANDPGRLMEFLEDPGNRDEAVKLGLVNKPPEVDRKGVEVAPVVAVAAGAPPAPSA